MAEQPPRTSGRKHFYWQCQKCGHTEVAKNPPEKCSACGAPRQDFILLEHD